MNKKHSNQPKKIQNRRARFDYELGDSFVVGLVLNGRETKSLRMGRGNLRGAYITVKDNELWLINATITGGNGIPIEDTEKTQARKLLARRREIDSFIAAKSQGRTIVPTEMLTGGRFIKLRISLGRGKKHYDKRESLKRKDQNREMGRLLKGA